MSNEIDHEYTSNIVCPYCGAEDEESYHYLSDEWENDDIAIDCGNCNKEFSMSYQKDVTYSTFKVNGTKDGRDKLIQDMKNELYKKFKEEKDDTGEWFRKFCDEYDNFRKEIIGKYFEEE